MSINRKLNRGRTHRITRGFVGFESLEGRCLMSVSALSAATFQPLNPVKISTQATYVVTNTGDNGGVNPAVGQGTGTLRQAIVDADASTANSIYIYFAIPAVNGSSAETIQLKSDLPALSTHADLDATTQVNGSITIDGSKYSQGGKTGTGLTVTGNDATVKGLTFKNFQNGIVVENASNVTLFGNDIASGIGQDGILIQSSNYDTIQFNAVQSAAKDGIDFSDSDYNLLGGPYASQVNSIQPDGGSSDAVVFENYSSYNQMQGVTVGGHAIGTFIDTNSYYNSVSGCGFFGPTVAGVQVQGAYNTINNNDIVGAGAGSGIIVGNTGNAITNNALDGWDNGIVLDSFAFQTFAFGSESVTLQPGLGFTNSGMIIPFSTTVTGNIVYQSNDADIDVQAGAFGNYIGTAQSPNILYITGSGNNKYGVTVEGTANTGVNDVIKAGNEVYGVKLSGSGNSFTEA